MMEDVKCSFCGKASSETNKVIENNGRGKTDKKALICFDCVKKFKKELDENKQGE